MITLTAHENYNPRFAPSGAKKAYIARITGRDSKMTFAREFIGKTSADVDSVGLYATRSVDKKGRDEGEEYPMVYVLPNGTLEETYVTKEEAMTLAKALESRTFDSIVSVNADGTWEFCTAKKAEQAAVAQTIDSATNACWAVLSALPEKEVKKVLAALKARVSPKLPPAVEPLSPETPVGIANDYAQEAGASEVSAGWDQTPVMAHEGMS